MLRISYARVLVELNLLAELKSFIVINLPNGATLNQPVIYETLPKFCKLCKVLGHKTGTCTPSHKPVVEGPVSKQNHPATTTNKDRSVFDRLGPVDEPSLGKAKGQLDESSHSYDPMDIEVAAAYGEWETVQRKKARKSPSIPVRGTLTADHASTIQPSSKAPTVLSSGNTCLQDAQHVHAVDPVAPTDPQPSCVAQDAHPCSHNTATGSKDCQTVAAPIDPHHSTLIDVPTDPQLFDNAKEKQQCDHAPVAVISDGWETVRRKRHGNKQHSPSTKVMPAVNSHSTTQTTSIKGKKIATTNDVYVNRMQRKVASGMLTRSFVQRNSNKSSGSGGESPILPQLC
ncbi:hypothetical protein NC651_032771 [Populus alba x Populus x berolinensis]|nr:hypothetical protein NC651_032771 [Populus alba x Populus x berolinensis]